jgi:hypothetical protein
MCKFFSLVSNGDGKALYFDAKIRQQIKDKKLSYEPDSHTSIADYFGFKAVKEDKLNKYEYNPITKVFTIDQKNNPKDDSEDIKKFCNKLDFKLIIPELNIHPIVHPFKDFSVTKVTSQDLQLLKQWDSVRASVWASVGAYISSYFNLDTWKYIKHKKGLNPFQSCIDLWNKGIVPSYDGKVWRLHGKEGKVIWTGTIKEIK